MSDFDNYIKEKYPKDYENLKLNYPDVVPSEFYPEAEDAWNHQQQKIDELQRRIDDALKELELLDYFRTGNSDNAIKILKGEQK